MPKYRANKREYLTNVPREEHIRGRITITNTTGAVASYDIIGAQNTAPARTGTGTYTITVDNPYKKFIGADFTVLAATAVDIVPQLVSQVGSTGVITFKTLAGASATDSAQDITIYVDICISQNSALV